MSKQQLRINDGARMATKADGSKLPVLDATFSCLIQPNEDDIKNSIRGDHANCMYCRACRRMYASDLVWVTRTLAYVELKGKGGKPELRRFILTEPARKNVKAFDAGTDVTPEAVIFAAPSGGRTLDAKAAAWKRWGSKQNEKKKKERKQKKHAYLKGENPAGPKKPNPFFSALRDPAIGMFQFKSPKKKLKHGHPPGAAN